jgi:hypothetical protein
MNRTLENGPHKYSQLIFDKEAIQFRKKYSFQHMVGKIEKKNIKKKKTKRETQILLLSQKLTQRVLQT